MKLLLFLLFFFYVFSTQFVFVPGHLGTRVLIGIVGMLYFFIHLNKQNKVSRRNFGKYLLSLVPIAFMSFLTMFVNNTSDAEFVKYFFSMIIIFFASYFVTELFSRFNRCNITDIIDMLKYAAILHILIALCAFVIPPLKDLLIGIQVLEIKNRFDADYVFAARLVGLGPPFFVAGIVYCCTLVLMTYKFLFKKMSSREVTFDVCAYFFIILFGIFTSRMTILGLLFSLLLAISTKSRNRQNSWRKIMPASLFLIPILFSLYMSTIYNNPEMEIMVNHGFEILQNLQDKGEATSASTNTLLGMFEAYPSDIDTYVFGDGYFSSPDGNGYYKNIDIGYYRLIYYFGLIGTIFYFLFQYNVILLMKKKCSQTNKLIVVLFGMLLVMNLKGYADIASITLLFTFYRN